MAEYTRGIDQKQDEVSVHNKKLNQSPKISPVNGFEGMNFEQVRAPYLGGRNGENEFEKDKAADNTGRQRGGN